MATEFLYEAITKYISPLLDLCGLYINLQDGRIMYRDDNVTEMKFVNPRYNGQPDVSPTITPCVPLNDEHFLNIRSAIGYEPYNPFVNRNHILALLIKIRSAMVPYCVSKEKLDLCTDESDYEALENFISLYNSTAENGDCIIGFTNTETPEKVKDLYKYQAEDLNKAAWGLAVTIYKDINHKWPKEFDDIDKSWRKIQILCNKWDKARKTIKKEIKEDKLENFNMNYIELSTDTINELKDTRKFNFKNDYVLNDDDVSQGLYLNSLFDANSFGFVSDDDVIKETIMEMEMPKTDYMFSPSNQQIPDIQYSQPVETVMTIDGPDVSVNNEIVENVYEPQKKETGGFKVGTNNGFNPMAGMQNPMMYNYGMNPMMGGMNLYGNQLNNTSYNMQELDLTGGDVVNPYRAYGGF